MKIKNEFIPYEQALALKELGFDEPTPHCYIHTDGENYELELFSYLLCDEGTLSEVYEDDKKIKSFNNHYIRNEVETHFNYNQDIRKLVTKLYNGTEYMNDEKSYNMNVNSRTYETWTVEEEEENKKTLLNYNDGDFEFTTYRDVISAPTFSQTFRWFREKYNLHYIICKNMHMDGYGYREVIQITYMKEDKNNIFKTYEEAELECLKKLIEIVKNK